MTTPLGEAKDFRLIGKVNKDALFTSKVRPKISSVVVNNIDDVKNWSDLKSFINTVDRIRFKDGVTGKVIQEIIDNVRQ